MFHFLRGTAFIAAMLFSCGVSFAFEDLNSANHIMSGCRSLLAEVLIRE